jgi:hypothetical protein
VCVLPHADTNYIWRKVGDIYPDALSDGQTYGRKDGAWAVMTGGAAQTTHTVLIDSLTYASLIPTSTDVVILNSDQAQGVDVELVGQPTLEAGTFDGQRVTLMVAREAQVREVVLYQNGNPSYPATGLELLGTEMSIGLSDTMNFRNAAEFIWNGEYWWQVWGPVASQALEATLLPAPWGPPDADGNQVIRDDVQDALIDALLPRLLQRLEPAAGTLPSPAPAPRRMGKPGTRANPIDWPAAPEPAAAAGKYHININIGDQ